MASYSQYNDQRDQYGAMIGEAALNIAPFLIGVAGQGIEPAMRKRAARFGTGRRYDRFLARAERSPRLAGMLAEKEALGIVDRFGVFTGEAYNATKTAGLQKQLAKIAFGRIANFSMKMFNVAMFAPLLGEGAYAITRKLHEFGIKGPRLEMGGNYIDTQSAYTERQRSLRAITSSRMSTRSAIGNEAQLMHR